MDALSDVMDEAPAALAAASSVAALDELETRYLGKKSALATLRRSLGSLPADERPAVGRRVKEVETQLVSLLAERRRVLERAAEDELLADDAVDPTLEAFRFAEGTQHVITSTIEEVTEIFVGLGYRVADGPEAETAWYNFDALNTPADHPARAESDTLYLDYTAPDREELLDDDLRYRDDREVLLRTQTSPMQARYMEQHDPPVYVVVPGRVFRSDTMDATHSPVFHQIEGLAVDTNLTMRDLRGTLEHFVHEFFGEKVETKFIPHFFPFTEPSAELHVRWQGGWMELLGCGMVDPNVYEAVGYDSESLSGFAFGVGVERLAMVRYKIEHIRHLYENDLRVLRQFV